MLYKVSQWEKNQSSKSDSPKAGPLFHSGSLLSKNKNKITPQQWLCLALWRFPSSAHQCPSAPEGRGVDPVRAVSHLEETLMEPISHKHRMSGGTFQKFSQGPFQHNYDLVSVVKGLSASSQGAHLPAKCPHRPIETPWARSRSCRFSLMATRARTALHRPARGHPLLP